MSISIDAVFKRIAMVGMRVSIDTVFKRISVVIAQRKHLVDQQLFLVVGPLVGWGLLRELRWALLSMSVAIDAVFKWIAVVAMSISIDAVFKWIAMMAAQ